jgi:hypothetical protein
MSEREWPLVRLEGARKPHCFHREGEWICIQPTKRIGSGEPKVVAVKGTVRDLAFAWRMVVTRAKALGLE